MRFQKDLKLYDIILEMKSIDFQRSNGAYFLRKLNTLFSEFGINNMAEIKFVTDRGSNVVKALENNIRLNCSGHLFPNVLQHSFKETAKLTELVEASKKNVKYIFQKSQFAAPVTNFLQKRMSNAVEFQLHNV